MTPEIAKAALAFLDRVTLRPGEIEAFMSVARALSAIVQPIPVPGEAKPVKAPKEKKNDDRPDAGK